MGGFSYEEFQQVCEGAEEFKNSTNEFNLDVENENSIQVILKGHLYIEHELRKLLEKNLKNPKLLGLDKFKFSSLNKLVFALGLLSNEIYPVIKGINDLRNKCAHDLEYTFNLKEYKKIEDTLSGDFKDFYLGFINCRKENPNELKRLQILLFVVWYEIKSENIIPDNIKSKIKENFN